MKNIIDGWMTSSRLRVIHYVANNVSLCGIYNSSDFTIRSAEDDYTITELELHSRGGMFCDICYKESLKYIPEKIKKHMEEKKKVFKENIPNNFYILFENETFVWSLLELFSEYGINISEHMKVISSDQFLEVNLKTDFYNLVKDTSKNIPTYNSLFDWDDIIASVKAYKNPMISIGDTKVKRLGPEGITFDNITFPWYNIDDALEKGGIECN